MGVNGTFHGLTAASENERFFIAAFIVEVKIKRFYKILSR
ncbi:hypothetical protein ECTW06591_4634 [Escherichia coli TW06591]|nr:hypothetical protein ECTW06591_4634 [Escherichia coli TW06591]